MDSDDIYLQSKTFKELGFVDLPLSSKVYTGQLRCASIVSFIRPVHYICNCVYGSVSRDEYYLRSVLFVDKKYLFLYNLLYEIRSKLH